MSKPTCAIVQDLKVAFARLGRSQIENVARRMQRLLHGVEARLCARNIYGCQTTNNERNVVNLNILQRSRLAARHVLLFMN